MGGMSIKIIGVEFSRSRALKSNLEEAMLLEGVEEPIEEVKSIDDILTYRVQACPALIINDVIYSENSVPEVEVIRGWLRESRTNHNHTTKPYEKH